jgi:vacuolar-type H+-ATPase subunit B/Vma2
MQKNPSNTKFDQFWANYFQIEDSTEARIVLKDFMLSLPTEELFAFTRDTRQELVNWFRSTERTVDERESFLQHLDIKMNQYFQKAA